VERQKGHAVPPHQHRRSLRLSGRNRLFYRGHFLRPPFSLFSQQSRQRSFGGGVQPHLRSAGNDLQLFKQLRTLPVPRKAHPPDDPQYTGRQAPAGLRRWKKHPRLAVCRRSQRGGLDDNTKWQSGGNLQYRRRKRMGKHQAAQHVNRHCRRPSQPQRRQNPRHHHLRQRPPRPRPPLRHRLLQNQARPQLETNRQFRGGPYPHRRLVLGKPPMDREYPQWRIPEVGREELWGEGIKPDREKFREDINRIVLNMISETKLNSFLRRKVYMKCTLFISFLVVFSLNTFAQQLQYNGIMEKNSSRTLNIAMVIEDTSNARNIRGYYYYTNRNIHIDLLGTLSGTVLTLNENTENSQAVFLFRNFDRNSNRITGTWQDINSPSDVWTVTLNLSSSPAPVPPIPPNRITIGETLIEIKQGNISREGQEDPHPFTAPRDGLYRFEMAELSGSATVQLSAWNRLGDRIYLANCGVREGITLDLIGGQTYQIRVTQYRGLSPYKLIIGHQKETVDISQLTGLSDNVRYTDQRNVYTFTAPRDGLYRFEMAELSGSATIQLSAWNRLGDRIYLANCGNREGISLNLNRDQTYQIQVKQYRGLGPYNLIIGHQKETVDISRLTGLSDSIQYTDQSNVYTFTAPSDGRYQFVMAELNGNATVQLSAWNRLGDRIYLANCGNGEGITVNLISDQTYQIQVKQYRGLSFYRLNIGKL